MNRNVDKELDRSAHQVHATVIVACVAIHSGWRVWVESKWAAWEDGRGVGGDIVGPHMRVDSWAASRGPMG